MITLVFFLEELSAKALLEGLLPRILPMDRLIPRFVVFEGKQDMEQQLAHRMRHWRTPASHFVVLRDQDSGDCEEVKRRLVALCREARHPDTLARIACRELESWYIGDLQAVEVALSVTGLAKRRRRRKYRFPDGLGSPSHELKELTGGVYQKVSGSRAISRQLEIDGDNASQSFNIFVQGVRRVVEQALE